MRVLRRVLGASQPLLGPSARTKLLLVYQRWSHQRRHHLGRRHRRIAILVHHEGYRITPARHRHRSITLMDSQKRVADGQRLTLGLVLLLRPILTRSGTFFTKKEGYRWDMLSHIPDTLSNV
jgi:hypothetical protein